MNIGGLNPDTAECIADLGGRVVWMPRRGKLLPEVQEILGLVKSHDMVLHTGLVSTKATALLRFSGFIPNFLLVFLSTRTSLICIFNSLIRPSSIGKWCDK